MNNNIKIVYQAYEDGILMLVYDGNEVVKCRETCNWQLWTLPYDVKEAFGIKSE